MLKTAQINYYNQKYILDLYQKIIFYSINIKENKLIIWLINHFCKRKYISFERNSVDNNRQAQS